MTLSLIASPTILSVSNERTLSSSSEEEEHGVVMRTVPPSALPENKKAEVGQRKGNVQMGEKIVLSAPSIH